MSELLSGCQHAYGQSPGHLKKLKPLLGADPRSLPFVSLTMMRWLYWMGSLRQRQRRHLGTQPRHAPRTWPGTVGLQCSNQTTHSHSHALAGGFSVFGGKARARAFSTPCRRAQSFIHSILAGTPKAGEVTAISVRRPTRMDCGLKAGQPGPRRTPHARMPGPVPPNKNGCFRLRIAPTA